MNEKSSRPGVEERGKSEGVEVQHLCVLACTLRACLRLREPYAHQRKELRARLQAYPILLEA